MMFSACVNVTVHLLYMLLFKICLLCALVYHVTFSSPPTFSGYQCKSAIQIVVL